MYLIVPIALGAWRLVPWNQFEKRISILIAAGMSIEHPSFCCDQDDTVGGETKFQNVEIVSCNRLQGDSWNQLGERISII